MLDCFVNCPRQLKSTILWLTYSVHPYTYSLSQLFSNFHAMLTTRSNNSIDKIIEVKTLNFINWVYQFDWIFENIAA